MTKTEEEIAELRTTIALLEHRMAEIETRGESMATQRDLDVLRKAMEGLQTCLNEKLSKTEAHPMQMIVYGFVGLLLTLLVGSVWTYLANRSS